MRRKRKIKQKRKKNSLNELSGEMVIQKKNNNLKVCEKSRWHLKDKNCGQIARKLLNITFLLFPENQHSVYKHICISLQFISDDREKM